jgi:hypothetical protein
MCIIACIWGYCKSFAYLILASVVRMKDGLVGELVLWTFLVVWYMCDAMYSSAVLWRVDDIVTCISDYRRGLGW